MNYQEIALSFDCGDDALYGIVSLPEQAARRGVLIVVGGPQYRAGSHRQFTGLARALAAEGIAAMRFDYRGMGDSEGDMRNFETVGDDLQAAVDRFFSAVPGMDEVVIWGLCDGASAAMFYAGGDRRVSGLVLLNPWARTANGIARTTLKHYYRARLTDPALWKKIARGRFDFAAAAASLARMVSAALGAGRTGGGPAAQDAAPLPERMRAGLARFKGQVLFIFSEADLTAQEFLDLVRGAPEWQDLLKAGRVTQQRIDEADHSFSRRVWKDRVARLTVEWVRSW
ncbi:hydrolase 1, exosortase A system-associated [Massilia cavernae]|uniref:hydrolase 1, exosortase A system-associated n=1 Tax=Massilia cavernae TaxID=2320864 RepID=UPI001600C608|nr:hydrolase 1, exosortase A system-associated [Massilia cavernae]